MIPLQGLTDLFASLYPNTALVAPGWRRERLDREHHPHYAAGSAPPLASSLLLAVGTALCAWAAARTQGTFRRIKTDAREAPPAGDFRADYLAVGHRGRAVASDLKVDGM